MDVTELEKLVTLVKQANIRELTLRQGEARITIRKGLSDTLGHATLVHPADLAGEHAASDGEAYYDENGGDTPADAVVFITSPLVGVFHHSKPVVGLGATVKVGQIVGVIKSMDLEYDVQATESGVVSDVLIEDGLVVEYGQQLFALQSAAV